MLLNNEYCIMIVSSKKHTSPMYLNTQSPDDKQIPITAVVIFIIICRAHIIHYQWYFSFFLYDGSWPLEYVHYWT